MITLLKLIVVKNKITLDLDTDREVPLIITRPLDWVEPSNPEEAKQSIDLDIKMTCEALCRLIKVASDSNYGDKTDLVKAANFHLNNLLNDK